MQDLKHYIFEAWGNFKNERGYLRDLNELIEKAGKKRDQRLAGKRVGNADGSEVIAKYPMTIVVDKMGYTPKEVVKRVYSATKGGQEKTVIDLSDYGHWLWKKIENNEVTLEELAKWYKEYEDNVRKNKWLNIEELIKCIDYAKVWDIYHPKSDAKVKYLINNPSNIIYYLDSSKMSYYSLSKSEQEMVNNYLADPVNQESISKAMKKSEKTLLKHRPEFTAAAGEIIKSILKDVKVDGKHYDFDEYFEKKKRGRSYYSGSNFSEERGNAYYSLVIKAIEELYGVDFYYSYDNEQETTKHYHRSHKSEEGLDKFVEEGGNIIVEITDLGQSKKGAENGPVSNSSFVTNYRHDFKVVLRIDDNKLYDKTIKDVTVATDFYSGGWS